MSKEENMGSITKLIAGFGQIDEGAAQLIWDRFFERLCKYANQKIYQRHQRFFDGEDIAGSAMFALLDGMKRGKFQDIEDRDHLWQLLTTIAARKTINRARYHDRQKRGGGKVRGGSVFEHDGSTTNLADYMACFDDPAKFVEFEMTCQKLLGALPDDQYRQITLQRLAGYSNREIAGELNCSTRTIDRKLEAIRAIWADLETKWNQ